MFTITYKWLDENRTPKGGYNKAQLASIFVTWPPDRKWKSQTVGMKITEDIKLNFEHLSGRNHPVN